MPLTVWALGLVSLFTDIGGEMIFPVLPQFLATLPGLGPAAVGIVEGVADAISHMVKPFIGRWSDRAGKRRPFVLLGYGISGASRPLLGLTGHLLSATLVRSSDRLGKGIRGAPRDALVANAVPRERQARAFALQQALDHTGAVAGPLVAAALLARGFSFSQVFLASTVPGALAFVTILLFVRESAFGAGAPKDGAGGAAVPAPAQATKGSIEEDGAGARGSGPAGALPITPGGARVPLPRALQLYFGVLFVFALGGSTDALLLVHARGVGLTPLQVTWLWSGFNALKAIFNIPGGAIADRAGPLRSIFAGWGVYAVVYACFALSRSPQAVLAVFALYALYYGFAEGAEKAVVSHMVTPATRGRAFGVMGFVNGAGTLIASVVTGWLYRNVGKGWAFGTGAAAAGLAVVLLTLWAAGGNSPRRHGGTEV